jgi:signal transduction histidine kinase
MGTVGELHERILDGLVRLTGRVGSYTDARGALKGIVRDLVRELGVSGAALCRIKDGEPELVCAEGDAPPESLALSVLESRTVTEDGDCVAWPLRAQARLVGVLGIRGDAPPPLRAVVGMLAGRCAHILNDARGAAAQRALLGGLSHELRAPLQALLGHVDLLRDGRHGEPTPGQAEALDRVAHNAEKILAIIGDVLQVARIDAGHDEAIVGEVALAGLLHEEADDARALAEGRGLELRVDCPAGLQVVTDGAKLRRIVTNLLSNAIKYTAEGGVCVRASSADDVVRIEVVDTGVGIPEEKWKSVFGEYVRLDASEEGTGLGLAIASRLAQLLGGRLELRSRVGAGTTVAFTLPARACPR